MTFTKRILRTRCDVFQLQGTVDPDHARQLLQCTWEWFGTGLSEKSTSRHKAVKYNLRHGFGCSRRGETFAVSARLVLVESGAKHGTLQLYNGGHDDPSNSEARCSKLCGEQEVLRPSKPSQCSSHWTWLASTEVQEAVRNFAKKLLWRIAANGRPCAEWQSPWSCCEWPVRSVPRYGRHDLDQVINIRVQDGSLIFDMIPAVFDFFNYHIIIYVKRIQSVWRHTRAVAADRLRWSLVCFKDLPSVFHAPCGWRL